MDKDKILEVENLVTGYQGKDGFVKAVDGVSFDMERGETICIVGESGSGKSVTSMSIMRLVEFENGKILNGEIRYNHESLTGKSNEEMRKIRGSEISMIFQEPLTALNPVFTIGKQITEAILFHRKIENDVQEGLKKVENVASSLTDEANHTIASVRDIIYLPSLDDEELRYSVDLEDMRTKQLNNCMNLICTVRGHLNQWKKTFNSCQTISSRLAVCLKVEN